MGLARFEYIEKYILLKSNFSYKKEATLSMTSFKKFYYLRLIWFIWQDVAHSGVKPSNPLTLDDADEWIWLE